MKHRLVLLYALIIFPLTASAVCQETDEFGNVSYVDCDQATTEDATPVEIQPSNTVSPDEFIPEPIEASKPRPESEASKQRRLYEAKERELEAAREALIQAREIGEGDRQGTVAGTKPTEQYLERVNAAEERVRRAEKALK